MVSPLLFKNKEVIIACFDAIKINVKQYFHICYLFFRLDYRRKWNRDLKNYLGELKKKKPVVFCGDLNVAHKEIGI